MAKTSLAGDHPTPPAQAMRRIPPGRSSVLGLQPMALGLGRWARFSPRSPTGVMILLQKRRSGGPSRHREGSSCPGHGGRRCRDRTDPAFDGGRVPTSRTQTPRPANPSGRSPARGVPGRPRPRSARFASAGAIGPEGGHPLAVDGAGFRPIVSIRLHARPRPPSPLPRPGISGAFCRVLRVA